MFITHSSAQVPIPVGLRPEGECVWNYVSVRMHKPWLHVVYEPVAAKDEHPWRGILFLFSPEQLLELASQPVRIIEINVVSPGYLNGTERWQMEPLSEIRVGIDPNQEGQREIFVLVIASGRRYAGPLLTEVGAALEHERLLFKI